MSARWRLDGVVIAFVATLAIVANACASAPRTEPLDPVAHARLTVDGFREADARLAARIDAALAWVAFPDVEDATEPCTHAGILFRRDASPRAASLRCSARPSAPAGSAYHLLVVVEDLDSLARFEREGLSLEGRAHVEVPDAELPPESESVWILTSERGSLLFEPWPAHQRVELEPVAESP